MTDKLTPSERLELERFRAKENFEDTGVREVEGRLKCPACMHTEPVTLTETRIRKYPLARDSNGNLNENRSLPPENEVSHYRLAVENPLVAHDCEANEYGKKMVILPPGAQGVFDGDPAAELAASKDPTGERRTLGKSKTDQLGDTMEKAFQAMFERAKEGK